MIETGMGDYILSPAYDLMCTSLHIPNESDPAFDLYEGCYNGEFYGRDGFFEQSDFRIFAERLGIQQVRIQRILTQLLTHSTEVISMIENSFLPKELQRAYIDKNEKRKTIASTRHDAADDRHDNQPHESRSIYNIP